MDVLGVIIISVLAIIGLCDVIWLALCKLCRLPSGGMYYVVIPIKGEDDGAEVKIKLARLRAGWLGKGVRGKVIALDFGADAGTKTVIDSEKEKGGVSFITLSELPRVIKQDMS